MSFLEKPQDRRRSSYRATSLPDETCGKPEEQELRITRRRWESTCSATMILCEGAGVRPETTPTSARTCCRRRSGPRTCVAFLFRGILGGHRNDASVLRGEPGRWRDPTRRSSSTCTAHPPIRSRASSGATRIESAANVANSMISDGCYIHGSKRSRSPSSESGRSSARRMRAPDGHDGRGRVRGRPPRGSPAIHRSGSDAAAASRAPSSTRTPASATACRSRPRIPGTEEEHPYYFVRETAVVIIPKNYAVPAGAVTICPPHRAGPHPPEIPEEERL